MIIELDKFYKDRQGEVWCIKSTTGSKLYPITGGRWNKNNTRYHVRVWYSNGQYWDDREDKWDLVEEVQNPDSKGKS